MGPVGCGFTKILTVVDVNHILLVIGVAIEATPVVAELIKFVNKERREKMRFKIKTFYCSTKTYGAYISKRSIFFESSSTAQFVFCKNNIKKHRKCYITRIIVGFSAPR